MHSIKVPHADHCWAEAGGNVVEFVEDLHKSEKRTSDFGPRTSDLVPPTSDPVAMADSGSLVELRRLRSEV
jgi:hypothetical protein